MIIKKFLHPITVIISRIRKVKTGDLDSTIPILSNDELSELSQTTNNFIYEIKNLIMQKHNLILDVSHELKSPLTRLRFLLEDLPHSNNKMKMNKEINKTGEIPILNLKNIDNETYYQHINSVLDQKPNITMDDGADLVATLHTEKTDLLDNIIGGTEETTTGVIRLKSLAKENKLKYPIIAVNEAETKHLFDNRYGTGQSHSEGSCFGKLMSPANTR